MWDHRDAIAKSGVIQLVNEDTEESGSLLVRIWHEVAIDLDDE